MPLSRDSKAMLNNMCPGSQGAGLGNVLEEALVDVQGETDWTQIEGEVGYDVGEDAFTVQTVPAALILSGKGTPIKIKTEEGSLYYAMMKSWTVTPALIYYYGPIPPAGETIDEIWFGKKQLVEHVQFFFNDLLPGAPLLEGVLASIERYKCWARPKAFPCFISYSLLTPDSVSPPEVQLCSNGVVGGPAPVVFHDPIALLGLPFTPEIVPNTSIYGWAQAGGGFDTPETSVDFILPTPGGAGDAAKMECSVGLVLTDEDISYPSP